MRLRSLAVGIILTAAATPRAAAQIPFVDALVKNVQDVNFGLVLGDLTSQTTLTADRVRGVTFELSFAVASHGCVDRTREARTAGLCERRRKAREDRERLRRECEIQVTKTPECLQLATGEGRKQVSTEVETAGGAVTTTTRYEPKDPVPTGNTGSLLGVEVAVGYSQLTGFTSTDPALGVTGAVEDLPSVNVFVALLPDNTIAPYLGLKAGLTRLSGFVRRPSGAAQSDGTGSSYLLGIGGGIAGGSDRFQLFAEYNYTYRRFPTVRWSGTEAPPATVAGNLNLSTHTVTFGLVVTIK